MGLGYVVTKRVFGFDKDKNEKYVAKSVRSGKVSLVPSLLLSVLRVRMTRRRSYPSRSFRERSYSIREKSSKIRWKI